MVEDAREAEYLRQELANGWDNPKAAAALQAWDAQQQSEEAQLAVEDNRQNEEVAEQGGYIIHDVSAIWDTLTLDGDARMEAVNAAASASVPTEVQEQGPNGETIVRKTTLDEQETARQQAMWDSLNPVQQALISIGRGGEAAWDVIGFGDVDDVRETVLDGVESGKVNDVLQLIGSLKTVVGVVGGPTAAGWGGIKLLIAGIKNGKQGVSDFVVKEVSKSMERFGKDTLNQSADVVLSTPKGAATAKVMANAPDEGTAIKAGELLMEKVDVVAEPLLRANNIRKLDPALAAKVAQKRIVAQKTATKKIQQEVEDAQQVVRDRAKARRQARKDLEGVKTRQDVESTLGLRGQRKRAQAEANKAAAKKLPGGF